MPGMDGATFLARTRTLAPNAGRILLTDPADLQSALAAVNEAEILRFLSKPYQAAELHAVVEAALEHQRRSNTASTGLRRALTAQIHSQDPITGLASRARFIEMLEAYCADADGKDSSCTRSRCSSYR